MRRKDETYHVNKLLITEEQKPFHLQLVWSNFAVRLRALRIPYRIHARVESLTFDYMHMYILHAMTIPRL